MCAHINPRIKGGQSCRPICISRFSWRLLPPKGPFVRNLLERIETICLLPREFLSTFTDPAWPESIKSAYSKGPEDHHWVLAHGIAVRFSMLGTWQTLGCQTLVGIGDMCHQKQHWDTEWSGDGTLRFMQAASLVSLTQARAGLFLPWIYGAFNTNLVLATSA